MWTITFCALSVVLSILSLAWARSAVLTARHALASPPQKLASLTSQVESLTTSRDEMLSLLADLANRLKMQRVRAATSHTDRGPTPTRGGGDEPDPYKDPEAWRKMMNRRMVEAKTGMKL